MVACEAEWSGIGAERAENWMSGSGAVSGCEKNWLEWERSKSGWFMAWEWSGERTKLAT